MYYQAYYVIALSRQANYVDTAKKRYVYCVHSMDGKTDYSIYTMTVATSITVLTEEQLCARLQVKVDNNTVANGIVVLVQRK